MSGKITLKNHTKGSVTLLSNTFIDEYMNRANGEFVKIYIYLLRCLQAADARELSLSSIADKFDHTENDVRRALTYWEKVHLLHIIYDKKQQIVSLEFIDFSNKEKRPADPLSSFTETPAPNIPHPLPLDAPADKPAYSVEQLTKFTNDSEIRNLMFVVERYLNKTLSSNDIATILYWIDELEFSTDLVTHLIDYCVTNGHANLRYMEKVALGWAKEQIKTVPAAKAYCEQFNKLHTGVMKALGITGRSLTSMERTFIRKWQNEFHFSDAIILEACRRTIANTQTASFPYTDSILTKWQKHNVTVLKDIEALDAAHKKRQETIPDNRRPQTAVPAQNKNKFNNFPQRSYDYDRLEEQLLDASAK